jgi:NhaP-type Na+/H+ or K+/H+ antiporter
MTLGLAIFALLIVIYAALAVWLGRWSITMPMIFVAAGFVLGPGVTGLLPISPRWEGLKELTEITLALLLFADASTLNLRQVRDDATLPIRLLLLALPLIILLGALLALGLMPAEGLAFAALIGAILAPTDAALGLPIFTNPKVPVRIRRALNVESGLNDGIATPFVTLFIALAVATEVEIQNGRWLVSALSEIGLAVVAGTVVGVAGGWLLIQADRRGWTGATSKQIAILGLAIAAYFGSVAIHGNGFIAAFVGGIVFGAITRNHLAEPTEFTENMATFMSVVVWTVFGAVLVTEALHYISNWRPLVYAILSLTVVRMVPVALTMRGTRLRTDTIALMGWFGPRGLASVVFSLLALVQFEEAGRSVATLVPVVVWTILLSVIAHGLSANPLAAWYAHRLDAARGSQPELAELADLDELRERRHILAGPPSA